MTEINATEESEAKTPSRRIKGGARERIRVKKYTFNDEEFEQIKRERTHALAYAFWEDANKPEGRDLEFWLRAENEVREVKQIAIADPRLKRAIERE